jgi:hypothetical protein
MKPTFVHFNECEFDENWAESPTVPEPNIWYYYTASSDNAQVLVTSAHDLSTKTRYNFKKGSIVQVINTVIKFNIMEATKKVEVCLPTQE